MGILIPNTISKFSKTKNQTKKRPPKVKKNYLESEFKLFGVCFMIFCDLRPPHICFWFLEPQGLFFQFNFLVFFWYIFFGVQLSWKIWYTFLVIKNRNNQVPKWCTKFSLETTLKLEIKEIDIANLHRSKHFNFEYNFININQI